MSKQTFQEARAEHMERLEQFVPIVERVHGAENPEFYEVRRIFDVLSEKMKVTETEKPLLAEEFTSLRKVTNNYHVPKNVCESYEAVYSMLEEIDQAYHND